MLQIDQPLTVTLTVAELNVVLTALTKVAMPYELIAPVIDKLREQVIAVDPEAFSTPPPALNGSAPAPQPN